MQSPSVCPSAPPIALMDAAKRRATRSSKTQLRPPPTIIYLRPLVFWLCWIGMLALHAGLAAYYIALAKLHQHLRDPSKNPYKYVFYFLGPQYPPFFVVVVAGATILAVCHLLAIVSMLTESLRSKTVSFGTSTRVIKPRSGSKLSTPVNGPLRLVIIFQSWLEVVIGRYGWLGVDYHHARLVFVCRELFEISCQIVQANRLSHLVGVVWVNRLFALVVVANCWSSPLIRLVCQRLYRFPHQDRQRIALEKVLEILSDGLLSIVYAAIIPYAIFQSYYRQFDHKTQTSDSSTTTATTGLSRRLLVFAKSSSGRALICSVFSAQESLPCRRFRRSSRVFALFPHVRSHPRYKLLALRSHRMSAQVHTRVMSIVRSRRLQS